MGIEIHRDTFDESDYRRFSERLRQGLAALAEVLARPGFGAQPLPLAEADLESSLLTDENRYSALSTALRRRRCGLFRVGIEGDDRLAISMRSCSGRPGSLPRRGRSPPRSWCAA